MVYSSTTVKLGCYYAAMYTAVLHVLFIAYALFVMDSGKSDEFFGPYFEFSKPGAVTAGTITIVFSFIFLAVCIMLVYGVKKENRCLFFPWLICMSIEILLMVIMGIWLMYRYYHNSYSFLATFVLWCFDGLHLYCLLCVISQYQVLKELQEPRFIILHP